MHTFGLDSNQGTAVLERADSKFRNGVGHKADCLRKVCNQVCMVHIHMPFIHCCLFITGSIYREETGLDHKEPQR